MRRVGLVMNPGASRARSAEELAQLAGPEVELTVYEVGEGENPADYARKALSDGHDIIAAGGGDGTVGAVASVLVGGDVPLGILPLGTANSVAKALGVPAEIGLALRLLGEVEPRRIDTAVANGRVTILLASAGLYATVADASTREQKKALGALTYVVNGLSLLREAEPFRLTLELADEVITCEAQAVTIANFAHAQSLLAQGPAVLAPDDGLLDVTIVASSTVGRAVAVGVELARSAVSGQAASHDDVGFLSTHRVRVVCEPTQPVLIDGEVVGETPLDVEVRPQSLWVVAPAPADGVPEKRPERKLDGLPGLVVRGR